MKSGNHNKTVSKTPFVDMGCCILCEVCVELAPHAFVLNDADFIEVLPLDSYEDQDIQEAVNNCPRDCILMD